MWPEWSSMLTPWQWAALAAVPPALVALYFLKLKRQPLQVPSTYLWRKSIEDLHVNSLWQKLRQSLLLWLQLALLTLLILALMRPHWTGRQLSGGRYIFLVDNSASMGATDIAPNRLAEAKRRVKALVDEMNSGDAAMIVSFSDGAQVAQSFTGNRQDLRRALAAIATSDKSTSLDEALRVAGGLANPSRNSTDGRESPVAEALPAKLFIFSDGRFADVKEFTLGNLDPVFVPIGKVDADNLGIVALGTSPTIDHPEQRQLFARIENFGSSEATTDVSLYLNGELADADQLTLAAGQSRGVAFELGDVHQAVFELRLGRKDNLAIDDRAWATVNEPRRARVLLVSIGNEPLELALDTAAARELAAVRREKPDYLASAQYATAADSGSYDLIIYDRCAPKQMPQANTFFIATMPPDSRWQAKPKIDAPQIIDTLSSHPLVQMIDLASVLVAEAIPLVPPPGGTVLVDSDAGPLLALAPRESFEDAVLGFALIGDGTAGSNWPVRLSFPVFVLNLLEYFGGGRDALSIQNVRPGQPVTFRLDTAATSLTLVPPGGSPITLGRDQELAFHFAGTDRVGIYELRTGFEVAARFAVNLLDNGESNIRARDEPEIRIGHVKVAAERSYEVGRRDLWKLLVLGALAILLFEWYIYNRRVYV